jgi:urease accessory protein UreH
LSIKAKNDTGTSVASTSYPVLTIPGKPTISTILPGTTSITFNYARNASDASNSVTTYFYSLDGSNYIDMSRNTDGTFTINPGVVAGNNYSLSIQARNTTGTSVASTSYPVLTIPGKPTVSTIVPGTTSITFNYARNVTDASNSVTTYLYSLDGSNYIDMSSNTDGTFTISAGVVAGNNYSLSIKAKNDTGTSVASTSYPVRTIPGQPRVSNILPGTTSITFNYARNATDASNSVSTYLYSLDGSNYIDMIRSTDGTFTISAGVVAGNNYSLSIKAQNTTGTSVASTSYPVLTIPGQPTISTIVPGTTSITFNYARNAADASNSVTT